jgi:hypothetical protein
MTGAFVRPSIAIAAGALVILCAVALLRRPLKDAREVQHGRLPQATSPTDTPVASARSAALCGSADLDSIRRISSFLAQNQAEEQSQGPAPSPAQRELIQSRARQMAELGDHLRLSLKENPGSWTPVIDTLITLQPSDHAYRIAVILRGSVDVGTERKLVDLLRNGSTSQARRIALGLLSDRESDEVFAALLGAAQDEDPWVRFGAFHEIAQYRDRGGSPMISATVDDLLRRRAQTDPDPELQKVAHRLLGEPVSPTCPSPPARKGFFLGTTGARSLSGPSSITPQAGEPRY